MRRFWRPSTNDVHGTSNGVLRGACLRWNRAVFLRKPGVSENGFGIVEVVVAIGLAAIALTSLAVVATNTFGDIALTRRRVAANSLMDQAIERVRALPYDTVKLGHKTSDLQAQVGADVQNFGGTPPVYKFRVDRNPPEKWERIPHGSTTPSVTPLVPLESTTVQDGVTFKSRTFVTFFNDDPQAGVLRVTTVMTYETGIRGGSSPPKTTQSQTVLYSPTGCLSTATHPFSGPCQAHQVGAAGVGHGQIDTSVPQCEQPISTNGCIFGSRLTRASLDLPDASSSIQIEQLSTVRSLAQRSQVTLTTCDLGATACPSNTLNAGNGTASTRADNDPGSTQAVAYDSDTIDPFSSPGSIHKTVSGDNPDDANSIKLTLSADDTGRSRSTTQATATNDCRGTTDAAVAETDNQPCAEARSRQTNVMDTRVRLRSPEIGRTFPARIGTTGAGVDNVRTFIKRYAAASGTTCAQPDANSNGCIHARAERKLGNVTLGGLPDSALTARPPAWVNCSNASTLTCDLVQLQNYTATVTAEAGKRAAAPTVTVGGTIKYWTATGYRDIPVTSSSNSQAIPAQPPPVQTVEVNGVLTELRVTPVLRTGTTSTSTVSSCATSSNCREKGEAIANSPILGTITYEFCQPSCATATWRLRMITEIDLGATTAEADYKDAPSG